MRLLDLPNKRDFFDIFYVTWSISPTYEVDISTKFHNDKAKILDFFLTVNFRPFANCGNNPLHDLHCIVNDCISLVQP